MKCIDEVPVGEWRGKRVLVRAGLDLPVGADGEVTDLFRLRKALPTFRYLSSAGARVIILTKIGRDPSDINAPIARALKHHIPLTYVPDLLGDLARSTIGAMRDGDFVLLENLQSHPGEIANDAGFAKDIASLGDIYVNDGFPSAHRESAGMVGVPKLLPSYAGIQFRDEVRELSKARMPEHPSFAILGGAKFETKQPLILSLLETYEYLFITGALANDVFKARGLEVGRSKISDELPGDDVLKHHGFLAPIDVTAEREDKQSRVKKPNEVTSDEKIVDIGPDSVASIAPHIMQANCILWNGPTGLYEEGYASYTHAIAELIQKRVAEGARAVIGGGDTIAAIVDGGISEDSLGFLSTGGGAMLEYLLKGTLPAIEALE